MLAQELALILERHGFTFTREQRRQARRWRRSLGTVSKAIALSFFTKYSDNTEISQMIVLNVSVAGELRHYLLGPPKRREHRRPYCAPV